MGKVLPFTPRPKPEPPKQELRPWMPASMDELPLIPKWHWRSWRVALLALLGLSGCSRCLNCDAPAPAPAEQVWMVGTPECHVDVDAPGHLACKEQSWDQENLKKNDHGCPTAIYIAPGGNLQQCPP